MTAGRRRAFEATEYFVLERMEPRVMLSADPLLEPLLPLLIDRDGRDPVLDANFSSFESSFEPPLQPALESAVVPTLAEFDANSASKTATDYISDYTADAALSWLEVDPDTQASELILIDAAVENRDALLDELLESRPDTRFNILLLESGQSGLDQLADYFAEREDIAAVHLISHGNGDGFWLGTDYVSGSSWDLIAPRFEQWSGIFSSEADWLLYGCELASTESGQELLRSLAETLGVDVAASDDLTGNASLGGDWELEFNYGGIEVASLQAQSWEAVLASPQRGLLVSITDSVPIISGVPGITGFSNGETLNFTNPNLMYGEATNGTFASLADFGSAQLDGLHYMASDLVLGNVLDPTATTYQLLQGDMLFSTVNSVTLGGVAVTASDMVLYRPNSVGDYSSGTFMVLLENPTGANLRDFSIIEQTTTVAGQVLNAGSWFYASDDKRQEDLHHSEITSVLAGSTAIFNPFKFVDGGNIGIESKILGVELVQQSITQGGMTFSSGDLLLSFASAESSTASAFINAFSADAQDIIRLKLTGFNATTAGTIDKVFDGSDVGLGSLLATNGIGTIALYDLNSLPQGSVTLSGTPSENQTLSVSNNLSDGDGLGTISYQWYRDTLAISGETGTSYILVDADVNTSIRVRASYTDGYGIAEAVDSNTLGPVINVNDAPTGSVTLSGTPTENQTLSVTNDLADEDGLGTISYQWYRGTVAISGETGSSYTLVDADVGASIKVRASYTDGFDTAEFVDSNVLGPVTNVNDAPTGSVTLTGTPAENQTLSVTNDLADEDGLGTISYQWYRGTVAISGETGSSYTLVDADVGASIKVRASYTDGFDTAEFADSNVLGPVTNVNDAPTGSVTLSGTPTENQTLSVTHDLADEDGLGTISYQWYRGTLAISGETGSSYTLVDADVGASIKVRASYTDGFDTAEFVDSNVLGPVTNVNDAPTGSVTLSGTPTENQTLSVTNDLADEDGLGTISYQWYRGTVAISGETGSSYTLVDADVGASIKVRASYTDGFDTAEFVDSNVLGPVINVNDAPTGSVTLSGTPTENQTLSVTNDLADEDGLGSISYQWYRGTVAISGETGSSYTLVDADVGASIKVRASYTDGFDTAEFVDSNVLGPVTIANASPTGNVTLTGTATENQTLSVTHDLADEDGLGTISYQWYRGTVAISGETGSSYTLVDADVGASIKVRASYTDNTGVAESVDSNVLGPVTNVNDAPTGSVTLSGTPTENQTLSVTHDLADEDGLGTISYQWYRGTVAISGETGSSYTLVDADVGASISVRASYTDSTGVAESVDSNVLGPVTNVNDAPTGSVTLTGTPTENQTLSVTNDLADEDGLGTISYQWYRGTVAISGETGSSYTLLDADVGASIKVRASYTDVFNTAEFVDSNVLGPVTNVNDAPTGSVTLTGTPTENQTLSVTNDLADEDGLGTISYQWYRGTVAISGETGSSYTLVDADVGASIKVRASYTDVFNTAEFVDSNVLGPVTNVNDAPAGSVSLSGGLTLGEKLQVTALITDEDGMGALSYEWLRNGVVIPGEGADNYVLQAQDLGVEIAVRVSYIDGFGQLESVQTKLFVPALLVENRVPGELIPGLSPAPDSITDPDVIEEPDEDEDEIGAEAEAETADLSTTVSVHERLSGLRFAGLNDLQPGQFFILSDDTQTDNALVEQANLYGAWKKLDESFAAMLSSGLLTDLERLEQELREHSELEDFILGGGLVVSAGLSAGYVVWLLRSGVLLSSVMTSLPAWRFVDPLPVLAQTGHLGVDDNESLQSILEDHRTNTTISAGAATGQGQGVH